MRKLFIPLAALLLAACATTLRTPSITATAPLEAKSGSTVSGTVRFEEVLADGVPVVRVTVDAAGIPAGIHGFHVHEKGDCSAPDATSAGGHFNPGGEPHGEPNAGPHHAGDFGNVEANAEGRVNTSYIMQGVTLGSGTSSIAGKAIVLHADPDDLKTQPTGNAGGRIACGVIVLDPVK
jgi:Cu-Zn family superoxide dismutase